MYKTLDNIHKVWYNISIENDYRHTNTTVSLIKNDFNGIKVQRDIYSAFLIMNVNSDLKTIDNNKCNETFENFYNLHNKEVDRLKGNKNLSSIAI